MLRIAHQIEDEDMRLPIVSSVRVWKERWRAVARQKNVIFMQFLLAFTSTIDPLMAYSMRKKLIA
jgi:hypothetical protein